MKLYVIRHGETEANLNRRYLGHGDSPLTARGVDQAKRVANRLGCMGITAIYSSDLPRAMTSASFLSETLDIPIITDRRLREVDFGLLDSLTYAEAMHAHRAAVERWYADWEHNAPPGGENLHALSLRVHAFLSMLGSTKHEVVALYTHGGVCDLLLSDALARPFVPAVAKPGGYLELLLLPTPQGWRLSS